MNITDYVRTLMTEEGEEEFEALKPITPEGMTDEQYEERLQAALKLSYLNADWIYLRMDSADRRDLWELVNAQFGDLCAVEANWKYRLIRFCPSERAVRDWDDITEEQHDAADEKRRKREYAHLTGEEGTSERDHGVISRMMEHIFHERYESLPSHRIAELMDYVTSYGDYDESTTAGTTSDLSDPMDEYRRSMMIVYDTAFRYAASHELADRLDGELEKIGNRLEALANAFRAEGMELAADMITGCFTGDAMEQMFPSAVQSVIAGAQARVKADEEPEESVRDDCGLGD